MLEIIGGLEFVVNEHRAPSVEIHSHGTIFHFHSDNRVMGREMVKQLIFTKNKSLSFTNVDNKSQNSTEEK